MYVYMYIYDEMDNVDNIDRKDLLIKKQYVNYPDKKVSTKDMVKMADFVLRNNLFEFDSKFFKQISGTAIGTTFAPLYACILWTTLKRNF